MNLLVTICARAGSKGAKNKNCRFFLGIPLVFYTLAAFSLFYDKKQQHYNSIDLAVNTDSQDLINQINMSNIAYHFFERNNDQTGDIIPKIDVIQDTFMRISAQQRKEYNVILDLDLTSPLRAVDDLKGVIDTLMKNTGADISFSVTSSRRSPYFNMVQPTCDGFYEKIIKTDYVARQQAPICYDMNASIYAYSNNFLTNCNLIKKSDIKAVAWKMIDTAVLDIDSDEDFELMEVVSKFFFDKYENYAEIDKKARALFNFREKRI
ncbi:MAG TPA: acylneuraminate cytidylyltransferase family protein [Caldisericia bacterium]|nr:acylneuraminate cytidylyltransferase family protein [Caldisericia bacterium]